MITYPLVPLAVRADAGEDVESGLEPIGPALGNLYGLVFLVISGVCPVCSGCGPFGSEVAVQFDHRMAGGHGFRTVDLDFVVALGKSNAGERKECEEDALRKQFLIL